MIRCIEPQDGPADLASHPHRLTLRGRAGSVTFPPLCPHCGGAAMNAIAYSKVFRHDQSEDYVVETVHVPFCDPCIELHRAQEVRSSRLEVVCSGFASMDILGAVFPALAAIFVLHLAFGDALHGMVTRGMVELGIAAVFALIAWLQARAVWKRTERFRVPPQTDVTRAFDFSDDTSLLFEGRRFVCTMRNDRFANAFRILNLEREWKPRSAEAIAERRRSKWLTWAFGLAIGAFGLWDLLQGLFA
jgi:hypothetical protein